MNGRGIDADDLKRHVAGRENELLLVIAPEFRDAIEANGRGIPCPKCGGRDRCHLHAPGVVLCRQCHPKGGDLIATVEWARGVTFPEALEIAAAAAGYSPPPAGNGRARGSGRNGQARRDKSAEFAEARTKLRYIPTGFRGISLRRDITDGLAARKPPITLEGVIASGAKPGLWNPAREANYPVLAFEVGDAGTPCGIAMLRSNGEPFPIIGDESKPPKTRAIRGSKDGLFSFGGLARLESATHGLWCEGFPDVLAVGHLLPDNWAACTGLLGTASAGSMPVDRFAGKSVFVAFDGEPDAREKGSQAAARAAKVAASAHIVPLPDGKDIRDLLAADNSWATIERLIAAAQPVEAGAPTGPGGRVEIEASLDEHLVNAAVVDALPADPRLFRRDGRLVQVVRIDGETGGVKFAESSPVIVPVPESVVRDAVSGTCWFYALTKEEGKTVREQVAVPRHAAKYASEHGEWPGVRMLRGIVTSPTLRADGTLITEPGYDRQTGLIHVPTGPAPIIPDRPTRDDAVAAAGRLRHLVADFPFSTDLHFAAWLAGTLTPIARHAFAGPAPLVLVDANVRASGKSLLASISFLIASGRDAARMTNPRDDEECRKRITAIALFGAPITLIDNVDGRLGTPSLDAALTSTVWTDRELGRSRMVTLPLSTTWFATGNNVLLVADTARRVLHVRLESPEENPEDRTGFAIRDIERYVRENRPALLGDCLTILRAYFVAGSPSQGLRPWGSFDGWSDLVRNAVVFAGLDDPGETRHELRESADTERSALHALLLELADLGPVTTSEIVDRIQRPYGSNDHDDAATLRAAVVEFCPVRSGLPSAVALGRRLQLVRRRVIRGLMLDSEKDRKGFNRWQVCKVEANDPRQLSAGEPILPRVPIVAEGDLIDLTREDEWDWSNVHV